MWRDSRSPHTSANRLIDSMVRFSSCAGISCTLTVSSTLYFAVFPWSLADCGICPRRVPSNIRKRLSRERLPQTLHTSCGLLLMVSQPAQNTALSRGTTLKPPLVRAPAFISEPLYREMLTRQVRFPQFFRPADTKPDWLMSHQIGRAHV